MKRFSSSPETLGSLFYPPREKKNQKSDFVYGPEFQEMLEGIEEDDCKEERNENKRRLSFDQVKALEKIFEVDNKLDPERKTKIAQELGLQPRQVAIWFQNRRARSKTKRLERDYEILKTSYEDLKLSYEKLEKDKEVLVEELKELRVKQLREETRETNSNCAKEGTLLLKNVSGQSKLMNPFENNHKQEIKTPNNGNLRSQLLLLSDNSNCRASPPAASSSVHLQHDHSSASMRSSPQWIMNCCDEFLGASPFQVKVGPPQEVLGMGEHYCWLGADQESSSSNIFTLDQAPNQQQWHY